MGLLLDLKNRLQTIDEAINHYEHEKLLLKDNLEELKLSLDTKFRDRLRNMEEELDLKMRKEVEKLRDSASEEVRKLRLKYDEARVNLENRINELNIAKRESIEEDCLGLDFLIKNKETVLRKLGELSESSQEIRAIINKRDIPNYSRKQLLQLFEDSKDIEKNILELSLDSIKPDFINKEFWFPASKLESKEVNHNLVVTAKFLNVIGVITLVGLYSNFIVIGLLGMLSFFGIKNGSKWKLVNQYRNWIYTIYEYESDFRKVIEEYHETFVNEDIVNLENQLVELSQNYNKSVDNTNSSVEYQIKMLREDFTNQKEQKVTEVKDEISSELQNLKGKINNGYKEVATLVSNFGIEATKERRKIKNTFDELNKFELNIINDTLELNLKRFHLGIEMGSEYVNYFEDLPFSSFLFVHNSDKNKMRDLMKYLTCQFASRLKGDLLGINIMDPVDYGEGLSEIVDEKSIGQYYNDTEVSEFIDETLNKFTKDVKNIFTGYDNIMQYNKEKIELGSTPYPYTLNLIQNVDIFGDINKYKQLLQTKKSGVINFVLISSDLIEEVQKSLRDSEVKRSEFLELMGLFGRLFTCSGDNYVRTGSISTDAELSYKIEDSMDSLNSDLGTNVLEILNDININIEAYEVEDIPFRTFNMNIYNFSEDSSEGESRSLFETLLISQEEFRKYGREITKNIEQASMNIFYFKDFVNRAVPKGKEFTYDNTKGILIPFGYKDGDVEKVYFVPLDGETIHYFMGGRTGMGKSNTLNTGTNSIIRMYSPDDLHIYLMDYKVVEGKKYMINPTPHFKCISVTDDPYYQISLFNHLLKILYYRQEVLLPKYNAGKVADIRKKGIKVPEIVIIIDEFTEALKGDDEVVRKILVSSDTIARLGRASGVHLFYTSQDVSSKIPDGMLGQFSGRLCLPVSKAETSKQILLNGDAADSDFQQMGNLLFNNKAGDSKYNVKIKVPLIEPEDMNENFEYVNKLCEGKYELNCVMFDAEEEKTINDLTQFLGKHAKKLKGSGQLVLGGNAQFDTENAPVGVKIIKEESNNILVISQSKKQRIELTNTIIQNLAYTEGEGTNLIVLRGNKDYIDFNYADKYKDHFQNIYEVEHVDDVMDMVTGSRLAVLERELKEYGVDYSEKSPMYPDFIEYKGFIKAWDDIKTQTLERGDKEIKRTDITKLIEAMRPYALKAVILVEGIDEVPGIGVDNFNLEEYVPIMRYGPYYGLLSVWNGSRTPPRFDKIGSTFKHRIVGSLREDDIAMEYRFMKGNENYYGGYKNIINPDNVFKFKIFKIEGITDDMSNDNRVLV